MKINDCMCKDVCFVKPDCTVYDAARIMCENHIGCIPICDDQRCVVGILTDRDLLLRTVACDKDTKSTSVSDIMTTNVCTCNSNEDVCDAEQKMSQNQIRRLPVVDDQGGVIGILTMGNLAQQDKKIGEQQVCNTIENICNCKGSIKNAD